MAQHAATNQQVMGTTESFSLGPTIKTTSVVMGDSTMDFEFFVQNYCRHANEKGSLYTWGSGEMGQLGYSSRIISQMPKDRDGYPF